LVWEKPSSEVVMLEVTVAPLALLTQLTSFELKKLPSLLCRGHDDD
jgi:hypothetical protein